MIGIAVSPNEFEVAEEFFELFKTPWERAVPGRNYRAVLSTDGNIDGLDGDVFLVYGSVEQMVDRKAGVVVKKLNDPVNIEWGECIFPAYGPVALFDCDVSNCPLKVREKPLCYQHKIEGRVVRRIGYDLFGEIRYLLTQGQPATHALTPTLELHIAFLRHLLIDSKASFVEIPPFPAGYEFICCLTHDVDFFGIRRHKLDRTLLGFVSRASVGTLLDLARGHRSLAEAFRNWLALCSLPLVFLGLVPDFWRPFEDYARVENRKRSTFFLVPFKGRPGLAPNGTFNTWRATPYGIGDIQEEVRKAADCGCELAVHGIDAWHNADAGHEEMRQLNQLTGQKTAGVRMHWLYFDEDSPRRLQEAGFDYDSTWGYNEAVGYRAGTSQAFRPISCDKLMELPMSIMDSALFSSGRMGLTRKEAAGPCFQILAYARRFGGTLVINWHERSLAPERLWGCFYEELIENVRKDDRAWFATAREAVEWFRWRRSIRFREDGTPPAAYVQVSAPCSVNPGAIVRIHRPDLSGVEVKDTIFDGATPIEVKVHTKQS